MRKGRWGEKAGRWKSGWGENKKRIKREEKQDDRNQQAEISLIRYTLWSYYSVWFKKLPRPEVTEKNIIV